MRYEEPTMEIVEMEILNVFCNLSGEYQGDGDEVQVW